MFKDKSIFITGASSGLGRSLAITLSKQKAKLSLMSRDLAKLEEVANECSKYSANVIFHPGDVRNPEHSETAIQQTMTQFGQIDHLILNAGISMWSRFDELSRNQLDMMREIMDTNYLGPVYGAYYALPYLKKTKGLITVISSLQGKTGVPYHTGYAASKHALHGFFDSLRLETQSQIDILMVCPSWIQDTELKQRALRHSTLNHNTLNKHKKSSTPLEACTQIILKAMQDRKREIIIPQKYRFLPLLKGLLPGWLDRLILAKSV